MRAKVSVEDRLDLQDLIARYAWALDTGDVEGYVGCFFEDGWIQHDPPGLCQGREAIRKLTEFLWYEHPNNYLGRQHRMSQVLMTPESENGVRIKCFWSILQHDVKTFENRVFGLGTWDTLAEKRDGEWRFASVYVDLWTQGRVPWKGESRAWSA